MLIRPAPLRTDRVEYYERTTVTPAYKEHRRGHYHQTSYLREAAANGLTKVNVGTAVRQPHEAILRQGGSSEITASPAVPPG